MSGFGLSVGFLQQLRKKIMQKIEEIEAEDPLFRIRMGIFVDGIIEQMVGYFRGVTTNTPDDLDALISCFMDACKRLV